MDAADTSFPTFESLSPSGRYTELTHYCIDSLSHWLDQMLESDETIADADTVILLGRLQRNRRSLRNGFQFQLQKLFSDFKAIRPARRLHAGLAANGLPPGLYDTQLKGIQPIIEGIEEQLLPVLEARLQVLDQRMKYLVHRSDEGCSDNPLRPANLCAAFLTGTESLGLSHQQLGLLLELYGQLLEERLPGFCQLLDKSLSELGVRFDLPYQEELETLTGNEEPKADDESPTEAAAHPAASEAETEPDILLQPEDTLTDRDPVAETPPDASLDEPESRDDPMHTEPAPTETGTTDDIPLATPAEQPGERIQPEVHAVINALKQQNEAAAPEPSAFQACVDQLKPLVDETQRNDLDKFTHYYAGLIDNPRVSDPLRRQLLRLAPPLLYLLMTDPFFFRSSAHPVNDFLHSMIDFEIRHGHQLKNLKVLTLLIDNLLRLDTPGLSDFQPITQGYEVFKRLELERLKSAEQSAGLSDDDLKKKLLEWISELTECLDIEKEALAFFYDDWLLYLLQVARQFGETSPELQDAKELARLLVWHLDPERDEEPHHSTQPFTLLLREIDRALRSLDYPSQHRKRLRRILVREYRHANSPEGVYAVQPIFAPSKAETMATPKGPELYPNVAAQIQLGDWIEFKPQPGSGWHGPQRGKLRWQSTDGIYRFFNQHGSIILEIDAADLNRRFARGEAILLKPSSSPVMGEQIGSGFGNLQ